MANAIKSVRETFLYDSMNKSGYLDKMVKGAISKGRIVRPDDLMNEVSIINRYYKYPMKKSVLDAFNDGRLKPVVLPPGLVEKVPSSIPFILAANGNQLVAYVFIDNYVNNKTSESFDIDPKKLYCLLESAYMAMVIQKSFPVISRSNYACTEAASIYAHMFIRVLNKKYALNVDRRAYAKVLYLAAKFFMVNQLGLDPASDTVNNYAIKVSETDSPIMMAELDRSFSNENSFKDLAAFITSLRESSYMITKSLAELSVKEFITDFVSMYHSSAIMSLEHFAYFMFTVDSVILGAYLNNQAILEDIVGKSGAKIYTLIANYQY